MHSIAGAGLDTDMRRFTVVRSSDSKSVLESKLIDGDLEAIKQFRDETVISGLSSNQILMQDLVIEAVGLGNKEILLEIVDLLASDNLYAYEVIVVLCFLPRLVSHLGNNLHPLYSPLNQLGQLHTVSALRTLICKITPVQSRILGRIFFRQLKYFLSPTVLSVKKIIYLTQKQNT